MAHTAHKALLLALSLGGLAACAPPTIGGIVGPYMCDPLRPLDPRQGLGESASCATPNPAQVTFACAARTIESNFTQETPPPTRRFTVRRTRCAFSNRERSRATCTFEYLAAPRAGYGVAPTPSANDTWKTGKIDLTHFNGRWDNETGHGYTPFWAADGACER